MIDSAIEKLSSVSDNRRRNALHEIATRTEFSGGTTAPA